MVQIRNVPDELHRKLKSRAALAGMSISEYLLRNSSAPWSARRGKSFSSGFEAVSRSSLGNRSPRRSPLSVRGGD
jgi:hypothetical protein